MSPLQALRDKLFHCCQPNPAMRASSLLSSGKQAGHAGFELEYFPGGNILFMLHESFVCTFVRQVVMSSRTCCGTCESADGWKI